MSDAVNNPRHYNSHPSGVECIDIVEHMTFNSGNAVKYLWRAGLKDGAPNIQDLEKARWYIDREIQRLAAEQAKHIIDENRLAFDQHTTPWDPEKIKEACDRFHPGEECKPGQNHPGVAGARS